MKRFAATLCLLASLPFAAHAADYEQVVTDLIPRLAAENVPDRYAAQMALQDIASQASKPGNSAERLGLGKVLAARAADASVPQPARVWITRQLEYMGGPEAVASLTVILSGQDAELRECARRALEKNPAPEAGASLRAALAKGGETGWKVGLVNSLALRGDADAVSLIVRELGDANVAGAACLALGRIASQPAQDALRLALDKNTPRAAEALVLAANQLAAKGNTESALKLYEALYKPENSLPVRAAALSGLVTTMPARAADLIGQALAGNEPKLQQAAVAAAANSKDAVIFKMLATLLPKLAPTVKAQVISILDSPEAEPSVISAVADGDEAVRRAALEALGRLGGAASVPVLLEAATEDGKPGKSTAEAALARISGTGAIDAITKAAGEGDPKRRAAAITTLAARNYASARQALLQYAGQRDAVVRKAAFAALRQIGSDAEIEPLASMAISGEFPEAADALESIATRAQDKTAAAGRLLSLAAGDEKKMAPLLGVLAVLGGDRALATVKTLTTSSDREIQENAVRVLGEWPDFAAAKPLLAIASDKASTEIRYRLALQGVVRLVRSVETEPAKTRLDTALAALEAARKPEDKKLVIAALGTVPSPQSIAVLRPLLADPELKAEATLASISLAEVLLNTDKAAAKELAQAVKASSPSQEIIRRADRVLRR